MSDEVTVKSVTEARQAVPRKMNFRVLVLSMILVVVAMIAAYGIYSALY